MSALEICLLRGSLAPTGVCVRVFVMAVRKELLHANDAAPQESVILLNARDDSRTESRVQKELFQGFV